MYLKELTIFGFKSFPEKTVLKFEPGITAVVGPNGCGKSNILDALKWALGEQAPKALRASKMEDVIFNGTESFPPLNYAEVTLVFSNEDNYFPIDYSEVAVTRRLYRSGESEYFINKNPVRLKDIQDLFMGTGIGEATYSFVEQGKIEALLSYKPEEKRLIFDEASGIIKYKERKKETLKKLQETDENLLRLEDIISEVNRQIKYLERQVEKAKKYKEIEQELIKVEQIIATIQFKDLENRINKLLEELNNLKSQENEKNQEFLKVKSFLEELDSTVKKIHNELEEIEKIILSSEAQIKNFSNNIVFNEKLIEQLAKRNENINETKLQLNERLNLQDERIRNEQQNIKVIEEQAKELQDILARLTSEKEFLEKQNKELSEKIQKSKDEIFKLEAEKVKLNNNLIEFETNFSLVSSRKKRLLLDKQKLQDFSNGIFSNFERKKEELKKLEETIAAYNQKKQDLSLQEKQILEEKELTSQQLIEKEKELVELNSYYEFLKELHIKYETFSTKRKVTILFEEDPTDINKLVASLKDSSFTKESNFYKVVVEAKIISLQEDQLKEKINFTNNVILELNKKIEKFEQDLLKLKDDIKTTDSSLFEQEKQKEALLKEIEHLEKEISRLNEEFQIVNSELDIVTSEINDIESKKKELENQIAVYQERLTQLQNELISMQDLTAKNSLRISEIDIELAKTHTQEDSLLKEKDSLYSKIKILEEEKNNILVTLGQLNEEENQNNLKIKDTILEIESIKNKIEDLNKAIVENKSKQETLAIEEKKYLEDIDEKKSELKKLEKELEELKNSIYNKKLEIQSLEYEKEKIKDYLKQVYKIDFKILDEEIQQDISAYLERREVLKKRLENLGEVNLVAVEEFKELNSRYEFLNQQRQDLITSKEELKKAIQKINKTSKELFMDTFYKVEEEFKNNFRFLFGGGKASLLLLDPENVLESGVEIEVQPPGKKLQNVSLLSGGEKALTAIALIFAIFKVKPSPLCVLDEIDAPLDEANVDRFNHLLKQFAKTSQFLIITHNKKTMGSADILYGVTMQEKGVSKLVSVKFAKESDNITSQEVKPH